MALSIQSCETLETVVRAVEYYYLENDINTYIVPASLFEDDEEIVLEEISETYLFQTAVLIIDKDTKKVVKSRFF